MPQAKQLSKLVDVRKSCGRSQEEAAVYLGLARSARNDISKWENGEKIPPPKYRQLFIGYLWNFLHLREDPERFGAIWAILEKEWGWDPLTERERQQRLTMQPLGEVSGGGEIGAAQPQDRLAEQPAGQAH